MKTLIYISTVGGSVFESQVVSLLKEFKLTGFFNTIILLAGVPNPNVLPEILSTLNESGISIVLYKQYPNYRFYTFMQRREFVKRLNLILSDNTIIHIRGELLTGIVKRAISTFKFNNLRILTDIRGAGEEEVRIYLRGVYNPIKYYLKISNYNRSLINATYTSDYISCVSESLKDYIIKKTNLKKDIITVNHNIANSNFYYSGDRRIAYRKRLGLSNDDLLLVFVTGGYSLYEETKRIASKILSKNFKLLNLSKTSIAGAVNLFVPYDEVPSYLCAADVGLIWRKDNIVNNVASPAKFSEYICCGLPVLANHGVHLIDTYIEYTSYGRSIKNVDEINNEMISDLVKINRYEISRNAKISFSSESIIKSYLNIYDRMLNNV